MGFTAAFRDAATPTCSVAGDFMIDRVPTSNASAAGKFRSPFRHRDIFFHDGKQLRRVSVAPSVQAAAVLTVLALLLWSAFATGQMLLANAPGAERAPIKTNVSAEMLRMQQQVQAMEQNVAAIRQDVRERYQLTSQEVRKLGLDPKRFTKGEYTGQGGPFEAVEPLKAGTDSKFKELFTSWKRLDQLELGTISIPSAQPVTGTALTSNYGVRSDPFRGRAAMHAGIDLAGPTGTPIYATADGYVQRSEWAGGYGNLVELSHGRGIQTRYGHLSRSVVNAGDKVKRGQLIAYMGSTGRSTGSHLHYEVRVDGKAVNPIPFMQGTDYLLAVQRRAAAGNTQVAMGGPEASK